MAVGVLGNSINGQVAAAQVFVQCDRWVGVNAESFMTGTLLPLGSGQRVFLLAIGV